MSLWTLSTNQRRVPAINSQYEEEELVKTVERGFCNIEESRRAKRRGTRKQAGKLCQSLRECELRECEHQNF
jgi:hypothetical protein